MSSERRDSNYEPEGLFNEGLFNKEPETAEIDLVPAL
jgi:hypothetical protein